MKKASIHTLEACKDLEWTVFHIGYFMDYFGMPNLASYLTPFPVLLDMQGNTAAIPGDGDTPITMTHTTDVGNLVAASLDLNKWDRISTVIGDKMTMNEAVRLAEDAKGKPLCH